MPKFLDPPVWYSSTGNSIRGLGIDDTTGVEETYVANCYINGSQRQIMAPGTSGTSAFTVFAPTTPPNAANSVLLGSGYTNYQWLAPINQPAVLAYSASAEEVEWLEGTKAGSLLSVSSMGDLQWTATPCSTTLSKGVSTTGSTIWSSEDTSIKRTTVVLAPNHSSGSFYGNLVYETEKGSEVTINGSSPISYGTIDIFWERTGYFLGVVFNGRNASGYYSFAWEVSCMPSFYGDWADINLIPISGTSQAMTSITRYY